MVEFRFCVEFSLLSRPKKKKPPICMGRRFRSPFMGIFCRKVPVPNFVRQKTMSQMESDMVGSMKQRSRAERHHREHNLMVRLAPHEKGSCTFPKSAWRGHGVSVAFANFLTRIDLALFRVLLLRRLHLPLLRFTLVPMWRPLDSFCHHRAAC